MNNKKMKSIIFIEERFQLPISKYDNDFFYFIKKQFDLYEKKIEEYYLEGNSISDSNYKVINKLCKRILLSIKNIYIGRQDLAQENFNEAMKLVSDKLLVREIDNNDNIYWYRLRVGDNNEYERKDLFHVPFQLRHLVNSYRYSIPGHPSLYLGSSSFVCWNELRRPDFDKIHIAGFRLRKEKSIRVLDFGYRPSDIFMYENQTIIESKKIMISDFQRLYEQNNSLYQNYIFLWPIIACCSVKVKYDKSVFKPEYIVPQLLFQWIRKNKEIHAIKYFSVSTPYRSLSSFSTNPIDLVHNYVFPTNEFKTRGYCEELISKFEISNPIIWGLCSNFNMQDIENKRTRSYSLELMHELPVLYHDTKFWQIENVLLNAAYDQMIEFEGDDDRKIMRFRNKSRTYIVYLDDILFIETVSGKPGKLCLVLQNKYLEIIGTMKNLEASLPANFIRIHRSFIVNISYIISVDRSSRSLSLHIPNNYILPLSRKYQEYFLSLLSKGISNLT